MYGFAVATGRTNKARIIATICIIGRTEIHDAIVGLTQEQIENTPGSINRNNKMDNLRSLLEKTVKGKSVLSYYEQNKSFTKPLRDKLTESIIENFMEENFDKR